MFIELEPIFNNIGASVPFDYEMDMSDEEFWAGKPFQKAVRVKGEAVNRAGIVCIEAQATVEVFTDCDRCASSIDRVFDIPVSHTLVTSLNDEENDELILVEDMHFELDPLVREDIFLTLPSKILCKEDCKGVCQFCGANLNEGQCSCKKPVDPRLEAPNSFWIIKRIFSTFNALVLRRCSTWRYPREEYQAQDETRDVPTFGRWTLPSSLSARSAGSTRDPTEYAPSAAITTASK